MLGVLWRPADGVYVYFIVVGDGEEVVESKSGASEEDGFEPESNKAKCD